MIVVHDYRGYGAHIEAVAAGVRPVECGRHDPATLPLDSKRHVETVTCLRLSAALAEAAGERLGKRWVDFKLAQSTPAAGI